MCVYPAGEDKGAGSKASSAVSFTFLYLRELYCTNCVFHAVFGMSCLMFPLRVCIQSGSSHPVSTQHLRPDPGSADHLLLDVQLHRDPLLYSAKSPSLHSQHRDTSRCGRAHALERSDNCECDSAEESLLTLTNHRKWHNCRLCFLPQWTLCNHAWISLFFLGSKESLLSATISANEEAMTILEEVIMYTFQQCVYYITKVLHVSSSWHIFKV